MDVSQAQRHWASTMPRRRNLLSQRTSRFRLYDTPRITRRINCQVETQDAH